tara:strand:- start:88 stop:396 length:309 start_codon:yes stop_codon:yes gene_type:complete
MVKPFIFAVGILSAVFMPTASYALSLKKQLPPIVILYPDGSYYTVAEGQNVFVTDYPAYQLHEDEAEIRFVEIEPWDKRDFDVEIVPAPEPELIIIEGDTDG